MPKKQKPHTTEYYYRKMRNSIEKVTGYSLNTPFRKKAFKYLEVRNSVQAGIAFYKLLKNQSIHSLGVTKLVKFRGKNERNKKKIQHRKFNEILAKKIAEIGTDNEKDDPMLQDNEADKPKEYKPALNADKWFVLDSSEYTIHMTDERQKREQLAEVGPDNEMDATAVLGYSNDYQPAPNDLHDDVFQTIGELHKLSIEADSETEKDATLVQDHEAQKLDDYQPAPNADKKFIPDFCDYVHQKIIELQKQSVEAKIVIEKDAAMLQSNDANKQEDFQSAPNTIKGVIQNIDNHLRQSRIEQEIKRQEHIQMYMELEKTSRSKKLLEEELRSMSP